MEILTHPIYDMYEFNSEGYYRMKGNTEWLKGSKNSKYLYCCVKKKGERQKTVAIYRLIWECFKGKIPEGYEIDHIDNNPENNNINNLQCITLSENRKRRNHEFLKDIGNNAHKSNNKNIKGINTTTNEQHIFKSKSQAGKFYGCSPALVYCICEGKNKAKTFGGNIKFEYTDDPVNKIIPDERIGKSKYTPEQKKEKQKQNMQKYLQKKRTQKNNDSI
jgi:hypothetical protein